MNFARSTGAVLSGLVTFFALTAIADRAAYLAVPSAFSPERAHVVSAGLLSVMLAYWLGFAALGGYLSARLAPGRGVVHAGAVAIVLALFFGINLRVAVITRIDPIWFHAVSLVAVVPLVLLAGRLGADHPAVRPHT